MLACALALAACAAQGQGGEKEARGTPRSCGPASLAGRIGEAVTPARIRAVLPPGVRAGLDTVFYADTVDLDCDGTAEVVAQGLVRQGGPGSRPTFLVYRREGEGWSTALSSPSPVDGRETAVLALDLNGDGRRDLVTWGADEGGFDPRVFVSRGAGFAAVRVPARYSVRFEEEWNDACRRRVMPAVAGDHAIRLAREVISPDSSQGHGSACELPADTLSVSGDSLVTGVRAAQ